jgi:Rrf2 family protein
MIFSNTTEYALRAVVLLADESRQAKTTQQISEMAKIPQDYLSKILQQLRRAGIVSSKRGKSGGFELSRPPGEITLLEVVNAIDPIERIDTCPLKLKSHGRHLCPLHSKLDQSIATVEHALATSTVRELLDTPSPSHPLCESRQGRRGCGERRCGRGG